ncbi:diguanylate cyclase (GGDEF)-like protein/PAS domain S-box-containing protein [Bacillus sp. 3255]|nr:diguanylate cyclase (GGDEF)-like protein/PAS domain S-box-containing protein [Bacillus sp. 3255]
MSSFFLLSFSIALLASFTALNLARKVLSTDGWQRTSWLICSAGVMGVGIWSMHFIAMLAYQLPAGVTYDIRIVSASIAVAIAGTLIGFAVTFLGTYSRARLIIGGTSMGLAISGMHYIGMAALQQISISYHPLQLALSILIAVWAAVTSLHALFKRSQNIAFSGFIMAVAITGMHYMGMSAAVMTFPEGYHSGGAHGTSMDFFVVAMYVAFGTILIFAVSFISSLSADRRLAEQIALKASILESAIDGILMFKSQGRIIEFNPAAEAIFGYTRSEAIHRTIFDLLFLIDQDGEEAASLYRQLTQLAETIIGKRFEVTAYRADRTPFPVEIIITSLVNEGEMIYTAYLRDLTERKKSEELIQRLAYYDHLTGLPNRNQFNQLIEAGLEQARSQHRSLAVLFLDIYRFKGINDSLGHQTGDQVLQQFSALIANGLPAGGSASRLSGDEFVILLPVGPTGEMEAVTKQVQQIVGRLEAPMRIGSGENFVSTNIGISLYPSDGESPEQLLRSADYAMYAAKEQGRNNYQFFNQDIKQRLSQSAEIVRQLSQAFVGQEFSLVYQPKFDLRTGDIAGIEALLRWDNKLLGRVSPLQFIPVAEESRQINEIGGWVLQTAVRQLKIWHNAGLERIPIAVNLSSIQLEQDHFVGTVHDVLRRSGLEPHYLELEIKENQGFDSEGMLEKLEALAGMGVRLSIDDFGTGHASIRYLRKLPFHAIKIDKSFIHRLTDPEPDPSFLEAAIAVAGNLKLEAVAEGVESDEQLAYLKKHGCRYAQGYWLAVPVPADQFERLYMSRACRAGEQDVFITPA